MGSLGPRARRAYRSAEATTTHEECPECSPHTPWCPGCMRPRAPEPCPACGLDRNRPALCDECEEAQQ